MLRTTMHWEFLGPYQFPRPKKVLLVGVFLHPWKISHGQSCPKKAVNKKMLKPTTWYRSRLLFCAFISVVPMHCPHKKGHVRCHSCLYRFWSEIKVWSHPRHIIIISPLKWWPWYHHTLHHLPRSISVSLGICQETRESALEVVIWAILMREGRGGLAASLSLKSVYFIGTLMFNNIYLYIYIYTVISLTASLSHVILCSHLYILLKVSKAPTCRLMRNPFRKMRKKPTWSEPRITLRGPGSGDSGSEWNKRLHMSKWLVIAWIHVISWHVVNGVNAPHCFHCPTVLCKTTYVKGARKWYVGPSGSCPFWSQSISCQKICLRFLLLCESKCKVG
jgi:hypothetical protein